MSKSPAGSAIRLRGVRHNNLKNFDLDLPLHKLIVITGLSGSGKSSLAFDTLFAEGQRRYIETFSPYVRQFFDRMDKPQVDSIEGIPPAIAIEQRNAVKTTRSTVGTMTEICDYMKVLWPNIAKLHCRQCGQIVRKEPPHLVWDALRADTSIRNGECLITFDLPLSEKLSLEDSFALISKQGYQRILLGNKIVRLDEIATQSPVGNPRLGNSTLTVVQDRIRLDDAHRARFIEACEQAYHFGKGKLAVRVFPPESQQLLEGKPQLFSNQLHCARCNIDYRPPSPALFSFNNPVGACPKCKGFGRVISIDYDLAVPDRSLTLAEGAVRPWRTGFSAESQDDLRKFCRIRKVPMNVPFAELPTHQQRWVMEGDPDYGIDDSHEWPRAWYGVKGYFKWLESKSYKMHVRVMLSRYRAYTTCPDCSGQRFQPDALLYLLPIMGSQSRTPRPKEGRSSIAGEVSRLSLADFYALPIDRALALISSLAESDPGVATHSVILRAAESGQSAIIAALNEVQARLRYLSEVGLGYLTLDRPTRSLSGGETERVSLTTCLGSRLVNTLFVLDEPSVGLHPRDTERLVRIVEQLRDARNTVIVVEHEASLMRAADEIVDLGPGHGATGGQVVFQGGFPEILNSPDSLTGQYLQGSRRIEIPKRRAVLRLADPLERRNAEPLEAMALADQPMPSRLLQSQIRALPEAGETRFLELDHVRRHNLSDLSVAIPLHRFVCLTGVSGSGKTTLARDVLFPALNRKLSAEPAEVKASDRTDPDESSDDPLQRGTANQELRLFGHESLSAVVLVDQSPLGKTPRSNPAVYIGAFDHIREVFAQSEAARQRGLDASAFSFNSAQGQCERCRGAGFEKIEMQFLSDVFIRCPDCSGRRYRQHILEVKVESRPTHSDELLPSDSSRSMIYSWSIADLLDATVDEVIVFLSGFPGLKSAQRASASLKLLQDVGLGYLRLGQPVNTLSGGESQRLKLVSHLAADQREPQRARSDGPLSESAKSVRRSPVETRHTLFIFDEPTTGLHFDDVRILLQAFQRLVNAGHSLLVIEHNLDVIKCADWVIDLGPEAGDSGGKIVAQGTPEDIADCAASHTGQFLKDVLARHKP